MDACHLQKRQTEPTTRETYVGELPDIPLVCVVRNSIGRTCTREMTQVISAKESQPDEVQATDLGRSGQATRDRIPKLIAIARSEVVILSNDFWQGLDQEQKFKVVLNEAKSRGVRIRALLGPDAMKRSDELRLQLGKGLKFMESRLPFEYVVVDRHKVVYHRLRLGKRAGLALSRRYGPKSAKYLTSLFERLQAQAKNAPGQLTGAVQE